MLSKIEDLEVKLSETKTEISELKTTLKKNESNEVQFENQKQKRKSI